MMIDHKLLVVVYKKDTVSLSQRQWRMLLCIHQHSIRILYKPGTQLFMADLLSKVNHETIRDKEILGKDITVNPTHLCMDIPNCMTAEEISSYRWWTQKYAIRLHIGGIAGNKSWNIEKSTATLVIPRWNCDSWWHHNKRQKNNNTGITPKKVLNQLHISPMDIEKIRLQAHESICWINMKCWHGRESEKVPYISWSPGNTTQEQNNYHKEYQGGGNLLQLTS